jgi:stearoyl-CoA desaturase (delta-9 desaturase)
MFKTQRWNLAVMTIVVGVQVLGALALLQDFRWFYLPIMAGLYLWMGFGTTFYLHRLLCHRGFETTGWIRFCFCIGSAVGLAGNPSTWVGTHRFHHFKSDTKEDPHSPHDGLPYAHLLWLFKRPRQFEMKARRWAQDARHYWYVRWMERPWFYLLPHAIVAASLCAVFGWAGMLWCLYFPMLFVYNFTWAVNSVCHWPAMGYRSYDTSDRSRNVLWVGLGALGEGFHNNHHASPRCAAHGRRWFEIDLTRYLIWLLEKVGLAWDVVWEPETETAPALDGAAAAAVTRSARA